MTVFLGDVLESMSLRIEMDHRLGIGVVSLH